MIKNCTYNSSVSIFFIGMGGDDRGGRESNEYEWGLRGIGYEFDSLKIILELLDSKRKSNNSKNKKIKL